MRHQPNTASCLELVGEERGGICAQQAPVMNHRSPAVSLGGMGISRMRSSHSSQDVASITNEQDYLEYGPGIVDRLKSRFINLSNQTRVASQATKRHNLRSCASLEDLQDNVPFKSTNTAVNSAHKILMTSPANLRDPKRIVPKSPSMEILSDRCDRDIAANIRSVVSSSISSVVESEMPRRDIVRKYKSFFENTSSPQHQVPVQVKPVTMVRKQTSPVKKPVANIKPLVKEPEPERHDSPPLSKHKEHLQVVQDMNEINLQTSTQDIMSCVERNDVPRVPSVVVKPRACPLLLSENNSRPQPVTSGNSMIFDFRGKDVKPQIAVMPSPIRMSRDEIDGMEETPEPCGITFIGENIVVGRGSLIATRNKQLSIRFDDQNLSSLFEYEAEDDDTDYENEDDIDNCTDDAAKGLPSAVLGNYKPGALSLGGEDFQLGVSRLRREESLNQANVSDHAKPSDESLYSQAETSDLLF